MNIFAYDPDPKTCSMWIDDVRRNKMITEHGQMLTAVFDYRKPNWFKQHRARRINYPGSVQAHPCTLWLKQSWANVRWLVALNQNYIDMWHGPHKSSRIMAPAYEAIEKFGVDDEQTPFANCARSVSLGLDFTDLDDVCQAYKLYHIQRWRTDKRPPQWRTGHRPSWYGGTNASQ